MRIAHQLPVALLGITLALTACGTTDPESEPEAAEETETASAECGAPEPAADREPVGVGPIAGHPGQPRPVTAGGAARARHRDQNGAGCYATVPQAVRKPLVHRPIAF